MKKSNKKQKVLLAMSGGVDSSVAALLLKKQGYEVIGAFMKNYTNEDVDIENCNWRNDRREAMKIASILNIPLITLDFEKQYRKLVVDEMFRLYKLGVTPNPDVDCNNKIKFPLLWNAAEKLGANYIATGHYVQIKKSKKGFKLLRGKDESKDQSYFLYRLSQEDLKHSIFPIGKLSKKKVRDIALKHSFPNHNRKGTVGICFIGKVNLRKFLKKRIKSKKGNIINSKGEIIGQHEGSSYYTIGQKIGPKFGMEIKKVSNADGPSMKRWYVAKKDVKKNLIIAAPEGHPLLFKKEMFVTEPHWITTPLNKKKTHRLNARIRQVGELLPCKVYFDRKSKLFKVTLKKAIKGISEGQAVVFYKRFSKECLGGGVIGF